MLSFSGSESMQFLAGYCSEILWDPEASSEEDTYLRDMKAQMQVAVAVEVELVEVVVDSYLYSVEVVVKAVVVAAVVVVVVIIVVVASLSQS